MLSLILSMRSCASKRLQNWHLQDLGKAFCLSLINDFNGVIIGVSQYTSTDDNRDIYK